MKGMCAKTGKILEGVAHLQQSVSDIVLTPIATRIERRNYGSDVPELLDQPDTPYTRIRIFSAAAHALGIWEPRLRITEIQMVSMARESQGRSMLKIDGQMNGNNISLAVPLGSYV